MKTYLLDTNSLLRFLLKDVLEQYKKTKDILAQAKQGEVNLVLPGVVIPELIYAFEKFYLFPRLTTADAILSLISASYITLEEKEIYISTLNLYKQQQIDFVDCFLICKAQKENAQLFTFDKKLQKLASSS